MTLSAAKREEMDQLWNEFFYPIQLFRQQHGSEDRYFCYPRRVKGPYWRNLPVSGPSPFVASVERLMEELRVKAPLRYLDVLGFLPQAVYNASLNGCSYSDGRFGIDGSRYEDFRLVFLRVVGRCAGRRSETAPYNSQERAYEYANRVLAELGVAQQSSEQPGSRHASEPPTRIIPVIIGPPAFVHSVERVLQELHERAPDRYKEVIQALPIVRYDASYTGQFAGRSDGIFTIDGSQSGRQLNTYEWFRFVFFHEAGHVVESRRNGYTNLEKQTREQLADSYAHRVLQEMGLEPFKKWWQNADTCACVVLAA